MAPAATALFTGRAAEDLLLTGRSFTADEAHMMGIVNAVTATGSLDEAVDSFVEQHFVPRSALALRVATKTLRARRIVEVEQRLDEAERAYLDELLPTHDGVEGIKAFMDKRKPEWTNT
jgi:cyclohexa-1,5-dienecarbonyl-CoA hydratase